MQRVSAQKEVALHNQSLSGLFGTSTCTTTRCLCCLESASHPATPSQVGGGQLQTTSIIGAGFQQTRCSFGECRDALSPTGLAPCRPGAPPMWRTRASMAGQNGGQGPQRRSGGTRALNTGLSTPRDWPTPFDILATKYHSMGKMI